VLIIYQGVDKDFINHLEKLILIYKDLDIKIIQNKDTSSDQRAKNLNIGIKGAKGRYICFLDDDDQISQYHYTKLINAIKLSKRIWSFGECRINITQNNYIKRRESIELPNNFSFLSYVKGQFSIPIHSVMIDRLKIQDQSIIETKTSLTRNEDYFLFLKIASIYRPSYIKNVISFYEIREDLSNSVYHLKDSSPNLDFNWKKSFKEIENLKNDIIYSEESDISHPFHSKEWGHYKENILNRILSSKKSLPMQLRRIKIPIWKNISLRLIIIVFKRINDKCYK
jgi:hypothetical protein